MKLIKKLLFALLVTSAANAQLQNFSIDLTTASETCAGNGSITITPIGLTAGATILYKTYKASDLATPISISSNTFIGSLTAGSYKVVAVQALANVTNSAEKTVLVNSAMAALDYSIASSNQNCATGGNLTVTVLSGTAASFEIIAGPVVRPLQSSNTFSNLPSGVYKIRAYDVCGIAKVKNFTLTVTNSILSIGGAFFRETATKACDSTVISNKITPSQGSISYPVKVQYRLLPMSISGNEIHIDKTIATGSPDSLTVSAVIPRYISGSYFYELSVTDNCNTTYEKNDESVNCDIVATLTKNPLSCAKRSLTVTAVGHKAPFTVDFISAPPGFSATSFAVTPAPYTTTATYGSESNPIPFGQYIVRITDACGRTAKDTLDVLFEPLVPEIKTRNNGCFSLFGLINISIPNQKVLTASIISGPAAYGQTVASFPVNVSSAINAQGSVMLQDMPIGDYVFSISDDCGFNYTVNVNVPPFVPKHFSLTTLPSCVAGFGTVKLKSFNGPLTSVFITTAPASFGHQLPYNVSSQLNADGELFLLNLPEGSYTLKAIDHCGIEKVLSVMVRGYIAPDKPFEYTPGCGTFSVKVTDTGNGIENVGYFLQRLNAITGKWGHPQTGAPYTEGAVPNAVTGIRLTNNVLRSNLAFTGKFRIVKIFETYNNSAGNTSCVSVFDTFEYIDAFSLDNAYTMSCKGNPNDVYIQAAGQVVSYKIEKKNGLPFVVNNGGSNIFSNLEPAIYVFSIEDACGNKLVKEFNLRELPSVADATQPADMYVCIDQGSSKTGHSFSLASQDAAILGNLPSAMYTITYHLSQADADGAVNALPADYSNISDGQVIYARLVNKHISICYGTTSFALRTSETPTIAITTKGVVCPGEQLALTATAGLDSYLWSTGETTRTIYVTEPGNYSVVAGKRNGSALCENTTEVTVTASSPAIIKHIDSEDWTRDHNSITVTATGAVSFQYSLDGEHWQDSNVFENLETGDYKVYAKDKEGCGMDEKDIVLLNYPKYFTPNGDGHHEKWRIEFSVLEPKLKVAIYDRLGKLITAFGAMDEGWDGTYNGVQLPSTDYWFVVTRADGRELRGHFAMLR